MKKFKSLSVFLALILTITCISFKAYADGNESEELLLLADEYGFKDINIEDIPEGVIPVELNSVEELNDFMKKIEEDKKDIEMNLLNQESEKVDSLYLERSDGLSTDKVYLDIEFRYLPLDTRIQLGATYEYYAKGSFYGIEKVLHHGWNMKGYSADVSLNNSRSSADVDSGVLTVDGTTEVEYYILIKDILKYRTEILDAGFEYSLDKGRRNVYAKFR